MFHERIYLISVLFLLLTNFVNGFSLELIVYIPYHKYQVRPHASPWFSADCAVHRNHFFRLYQQKKSLESKAKLRQAINCCKRVLEASKLAYAKKTKEFITFQKIGFRDFWRIADSVLIKGKSAIPPLFNRPEVLSSVSDKAKLRTLIFMHLVSIYLFSPPHLI